MPKILKASKKLRERERKKKEETERKGIRGGERLRSNHYVLRTVYMNIKPVLFVQMSIKVNTKNVMTNGFQSLLCQKA